MGKHLIAGVLLIGVIAACSSSSGGGGGGAISGFQSCSSDSECPSGQGCDNEGGSITDGYCTPLCSDDTGCPMGYDCPSGAKDQPGECDEVGAHGSGQGVCDQFDGAEGPNTCTG
jgi:hypothetical protein